MCDRRRYYCKTLYRKKLFNFHRYNPSFGRKKYIRQKPIFNLVKANEKYVYSQDFNIKYPSEREIEMLCERDQCDYLDEDVFDGSSSDDHNYFTDDDDDDDSEIEIIISRNNTNQLERLETTVIPQQNNYSDQPNNITALQNEESRENQENDENEENAYDSDDEAASMSTTDTTRQRDDTIASEILHTSELETLYDENMCEENDDDIESETQSVGSYS
jgi:hypothetical protein